MPRRGQSGSLAAFAALLALTERELFVVGLDAGRAARITALAGLLMAKVVWSCRSSCARARVGERPGSSCSRSVSRRASGVVLMLETVFRVNVA